MARCAFVRPEVVRLTLRDGEWLEVKKELTGGEYREMFASQFKDARTGDDGIGVDLQRLGVNQVEAYVLNWSFVDFDDKRLPFSREAFNKFDTGTHAEIVEAVQAHHAANEQAIEARKNGQGGESTSAPISPSAA